MVQNPSQKELNEHIVPEATKQNEIKFFANHSHFQSFVEQTGREALENTQPLLVQHISIGPMWRTHWKHQKDELQIGPPPQWVRQNVALHIRFKTNMLMHCERQQVTMVKAIMSNSMNTWRTRLVNGIETYESLVQH